MSAANPSNVSCCNITCHRLDECMTLHDLCIQLDHARGYQHFIAMLVMSDYDEPHIQILPASGCSTHLIHGCDSACCIDDDYAQAGWVNIYPLSTRCRIQRAPPLHLRVQDIRQDHR